MKLIVYTAAIGETDAVRAPAAIDPDAQYLCFSDRPCPAPYERIAVPTAADGTPPSRVFKVLADHPALQTADATLWHDASYRLTSDLQWVREGLSAADVVTMSHPRRDRIEDEAVAVSRYRYVTLQRALELVAEYRAAGFTARTLSSAGLIARRCSATVTDMNETWFDEIQRWGWRDQASFDYSAWRARARVRHVPGSIKQNAYAAWRVPVAA